MHGEGFFYQASVYLLAAVVSVPIAKRLGLGSVLGYLLAGVAIGPWGLRLIGEEGTDVLHFAEFGVVMMLFLIGLELQPALLWRMRTADFYEQRVNAQVEGLSSLVEPVAIVLLGLVIALMLVALYLPIFKLGHAMRSGMLGS